MAVDSSKVLVNASYVDGQEVVVGDRTYIGYSTIAAAAAAVGDAGVTIEVSGVLESEAVTGEALNLFFTDGADVSLAQDQTIQLSGESTLALAGNAVLTGNTAHSGYGYGWDAIRSSGNLTVEQFDGKIDVYGQNARAILVSGGDLVVNNGLNGAVTAVMGEGNDKQNGTIAAGGAITINGGISGSVKITGGTERGRQIGAIVADENLTVNGDISGSVSAEFLGGNNAWGLFSWYKDVVINGNIAASAKVEGIINGASHAGIAIYARSGNVVINGEVAGSVYGKGGAYDGYGVYAEDSIEIGSISGTVRGDAYNDLMANTQSNAAALYAANEVSGGKNIDGTSKALVITESGELLSTVGRSGAAGIQAGGAVTVDNRGTIQATSEYLLDTAREHEMPQDHGNGRFVDSSWGGLSFGILANGQMDITNSGTISAVKDSQYTEGYELGYAIYSGAAPVWDKEAGVYVVQPNDTVQDDRVVNTGILQGNVALNSGDDVFTQAGGSVEGFVDMGTGRDTVNVEADWTDANLIFDGSGADILNVADGVRIGGSVTIADTLAISGSGDFSGLEVNGSGTLFVQDDSMTGSEWAARSGIRLAEDVKAVTLLDIDTSVLRVNAAWEGSGRADEVEAGYYYGINAFSDAAQAVEAVEPMYVLGDAFGAPVTINMTDATSGSLSLYGKNLILTGSLTSSGSWNTALVPNGAADPNYIANLRLDTARIQLTGSSALEGVNWGKAAVTFDKEGNITASAGQSVQRGAIVELVNGTTFAAENQVNGRGVFFKIDGTSKIYQFGGGNALITMTSGAVIDGGTAVAGTYTAVNQLDTGSIWFGQGSGEWAGIYGDKSWFTFRNGAYVEAKREIKFGTGSLLTEMDVEINASKIVSGGEIVIGAEGNEGKLTSFVVSNHSLLQAAGNISIIGAMVEMDYTSALVAASLANSGSINITVDAAMLAAGIGKLIDLTDDAAQLDTANITVNGVAWDSAQKTFTDADGNTYTLVIQGNDLWKTDVSLGAIYVNAAWPADTAFGAEVAPGCRYGLNAFSGLNQAIDEAAEPEKIVIAAGTYDESATQFVRGVEIASEDAVFSNVWSFGVNSDTGRDFDMETAEKFTVTGNLTVGQFYAEKNANVYVKIDGNLTTVGSFGAKLATQVDVNGTVTVTPPQPGEDAQVMVYGTMNVTGKLDSTSGAMGAVLLVGLESYETEYGKGGVLNVSGADASVVLRNIIGSNIPVTVSAMSSLNLSGGAAFVNENGGLQNLGTVNVDNATLTLSEALENSGTVNFSNTTSDFGTIANDGVVNFNGGNTVTGSITGSADGDVNFNGVLSFEAAAEGEPAVAVQKNGAELTLKAGRDVLAGSVEAEDVSVGSMTQGMISGVERLVLQGGSLSVEDLTVYAGSSVTMGVDSPFTFSGAVDIHAAGVAMNGTDAYIYGAGSFTVDLSGREEGKAYKLIDYTGTAVQDYSFVSNLGELENKLIFNNDLYITDKSTEILYVSNSYIGDAGDITADGNILGYNAFATAGEALSSANSLSGATIDLQDEAYTYAAPQGTGMELTNAGTYTVINGKGVLLNYELEVNPNKADGEYLLNVEDAYLTLTKLTLRANATMTVTDSRIDYNAFEGGAAYLSVYTNSVLNVSGSTIGFDPRQSKVNDPVDLPDAGTGAGAYWNWAPTWNIYGTANIEDSTLFAYVGQANQAGFDVRGNGTATITDSEVSLALLNVGTSYEENKLDPAADKSNLLATLTLDGTTVRNTQYRGDYTTQNGINIGQEDGTSAGKLVIRNGSNIDFTVLTYNDAREIGLSVRNDKSSVEISDSTFKAPSITNNGTITVSGSVLKADEVKNDGTILVSGTSVLNISALTGEIVLADGAVLTDSSVGGTISAEGSASVAGTTSVDRLVLKGVRGENSELSIGADAVVAVKQLDVGNGLSKPDIVPGSTDAREYFAKAQVDGTLTVDRANQAGAIYIRPYSELVVTGTLNVKGEVHNRGSLVVDGGTMNISDSENITPKLLGYDTGDSLTVTNNGNMILTGVSAVTFGEAHASLAEMGVKAQYADGMFATISAGGKFEADTLAFRNDDDVTLTVAGEGSSFKLYSADGRVVAGTYTYAVNEGAIIVEDKASFDVSGLANADFVNSGSITLSSASAKFATLTNNGTVTVSGASTLSGALSGSGNLIFKEASLTGNDISGSQKVIFLEGENTLDGTAMDIVGYDYNFYVGNFDTGLESAGATLNIVNGSVVEYDGNGYIGGDGVSTVRVAGTGSKLAGGGAGGDLYLRGNGVLNISDGAQATFSYVDLQGTVTVSGQNSFFRANGGRLLGTLAVTAGAEAQITTVPGGFAIGSVLTVNGGTLDLGANAVTLSANGVLALDTAASVKFSGSIENSGKITVDLAGAAGSLYKLVDYLGTGVAPVDYGTVELTGASGYTWAVVEGDLWVDGTDKSTILINSGYAGEVGSTIEDRDGYFLGFNALTEYSTSIGAGSAVEFTGGSYGGFAFTGHTFTVSGDTSFNKVTGGAVAVTGGTLSIDTVELTADIAALSGALLAFSGNGMADLGKLVLKVSGTMANRTKYVLATGVKDDSFAITLNSKNYELNVRKDGLLVGVENGELYVQKMDDWFNKAGDSPLTDLPADGYVFGGSDMYEDSNRIERLKLEVAATGQDAGARVYGGGLLRNDALFFGTQNCEVTVTSGGVGKGVIGGNRIESGSIGGTLNSSVTIDSADGTFGFIVGGNQLTGGELNCFGGTSVTIQNGTFSMWVCGGSVAGGDAAAQVMGHTNVTITGGTFNGTGVFGGGFVQENGTLSQVGHTNVTISGGTFAGNIYGGHGATNKDASPNGGLVGNTNITISGGIFNGNIYGGGFDQSKVQGDTHITFTGTAGADFSVNGIIDGDASNARYWSKGSFVTGDRYLTFDAFSGEFGATLITNIDQMEVTGGSDVNLKNQLDLSEVSQWEFDFGSSLEGFAQNDLAGDSLVLSGWEDQLGDEGWTVMSGSSITGFGEMEVTNGSNLIFAWNADEQYYLGSIGDEQFKLSMEDGAMKLAKLA